MQEKTKQKIKSFKNYYCDALYCALGEFFDKEKIDEILNRKTLTQQQIKLLCEYAVIKNKIAGVTFLNLKVPDFGYGIELLEKYNMNGHEIVSANLMNCMPSKALVGQRLMLEVESLLEYNENFLSDLSDLSAKIDIPIIFALGQDLEEVGKIVNKFKMSPVQTLESFGFLDRECYVLGLNFIDKDDQKLMRDYGVTCIFSPCCDGEEGKGAINLYNFIYNDLKFRFSSRRNHNIDMLKECWLAMVNTSNLMFEKDLIKIEDLLQAVFDKNGIDIEISTGEYERKEGLLNKKIKLNIEDFENVYKNVEKLVFQLKD